MKKILLFLLVLVTLTTFIYKDNLGAFAASEQSLSSAKATYLMDYYSETQIYAANENKRLPIASMTKIMLLNFVFENLESGKINLTDKVTVSKTASSMGGSQVFLQADKEYLLEDLVKSIIVASANDASVALAELLFGSEQVATDKMNERAKEWGLDNTLFSNCTGLPKATQYSSAKDVAIMLKNLLKHDGYYKYSTIWLDELVHPDGQKTTLTNTNKLTKFFNGCDGGKTGYTNDAGYCLACTAKRGVSRIICVVIGEEDSKVRFNDVSNMFNYAFNNYTQKIVVDKDETPFDAIPVLGGKDESVGVVPDSSVFAFLSRDENPSFTMDINVDSSIKAPFEKNTKVGELTVFKDGVEYKKVDLVTATFCERQNFFDSLDRFAKKWA